MLKLMTAANQCARCGRALKDPASVQYGFGPVCWRKHLAELEAREQQTELPLLRFDGDIVCRRTLSGPQFNIPQQIKLHSPTGMEWGYSGSGPADFALNILSLFADPERAFELHQLFKREFIVKLPNEGGTIKREAILEWLRRHGLTGETS